MGLYGGMGDSEPNTTQIFISAEFKTLEAFQITQLIFLDRLCFDDMNQSKPMSIGIVRIRLVICEVWCVATSVARPSTCLYPVSMEGAGAISSASITEMSGWGLF